MPEMKMHDPRPTPERRTIATIALALFVTLAGCGGGGGSPSPQPIATAAAPQSDTVLQVSIIFPAQTATGPAAKRRPAYISQGIKSLAITIDSGTPAYLNAPMPTGTPQTVTTTLPVSPGTHTFLLAEYDAANGTGNLLGRVTEMSTIVKGQLNTLTYTLDGQLAKIVIQAPVNVPFVEGTVAAGVTIVGCQPQTFTAVPEDADGYTIVTPGLIPAITESSATPASVAVTPLAGNQFTIEVPSDTAAPVAVTAAGMDLDGKPVTASVDVSGLAAFYVADFEVQKVRAFDENGTPLALPAGAFANISNPMGLATSPCTATASGTLALTETSNFSYPFVQEFDLSGNPISLASTQFAFTPGNYIAAQPLFLTYAAGMFVMPNTHSSTVADFDVAGNALPLAATAFTKLLNPVSVAYATDSSQYYVTNDGLSSLTSYKSDGTYEATVTTNSHPMGVAFDTNSNMLYVASGGTTGSALDQVAPSPANVAEYSEVPAAVTNTGGFTATSLTAYYTGIAFDPNNKQLYVSDAGDSSIVAYTEAGAAVTLPTGAFSTITATPATGVPKGDPMAILFVP